MKSVYDKLFLAVALLVFAGSIAFYLTQREAASGEAADFQVAALGDDYEPIIFEETRPPSATWELPPEQSTGVTFDVFTPPKIWIDPETNEFIFQEPREPAAPAPFGVYLVDVRRDLYRFQFQGFTEVDPSDPSTSHIFIFDIENNRQINARKGGEYPADGFSITDFVVERIEEGGTVTREARVTLFDKERQEDVVIRQGERIFDTTVTVELASREDPDFRFETDRANVSFSNELGDFRLLNINLENRSVTVEKAETEDFPAKRRILSADGETESRDEVPEVPETAAEPDSPEESDVTDAFESLFN